MGDPVIVPYTLLGPVGDWQVAGIETGAHILRDAPVRETPPALSAPTEGENLVADYASTGLTLGRHPLALLRAARLRF